MLTEDDFDFEGLVTDYEALRKKFREHVQRGDLTFGRLEAVSSWRYVAL